jgi:two-component system sensor kinase FixL
MSATRLPEHADERALRVEREFEALLDAAIDGVVVIDHEARIELLSHAAERMFGYREEELVGRSVGILMPEPFRSEHDTHLQRYFETRVPHIIGIAREVIAQRRDGTEFAAEIAVGLVKGMEPPRFVAFIRDITERKRDQEALVRSEAELHMAQELANLGNYVLHLDGRDFVSPQLYRMLGLKPGEQPLSITEQILPLVHPADRFRVEQAFANLQSSGRAFDTEYRALRADGTLRYIHHIGQAVHAEDGRIVRHIGTLHDITDRRRAEDEVRRMQERIAHFGRISTMGEMAAGIAHEVNQPLTAIATFARACQRLLASPDFALEDVSAALEQIGQQALRAGEVIRRLRSFVKNREVKREVVGANRLLEDLLTLAQTDARHHGVRIHLQPSVDSPVVQADSVQIQQVILNLVRNSIDAMLDVPEQHREITLRTRIDEEGDIEFMVADRGTGLDEATLAELFNPFFTTKPGGTGLGLAISLSIVRAHGGKLWCRANPLGGAQFFFTLPAAPRASAGE